MELLPTTLDVEITFYLQKHCYERQAVARSRLYGLFVKEQWLLGDSCVCR